MKSRLVAALLISFFIIVIIGYHLWMKHRHVIAQQSVVQISTVQSPAATDSTGKMFWIAFFNTNDHPPVIPVMKIYFVGDLSESSKKKAWEIQNKMEKQIHAVGPILEKDTDYAKLTPIVTEHVESLIELGASQVLLEFPRQRKGIYLYDSKK